MLFNYIEKFVNQYKRNKNKKNEFDKNNEKEAYRIIGKLYPKYRDRYGNTSRLRSFDNAQKQDDYKRVFNQVRKTRENKTYNVRSPYIDETFRSIFGMGNNNQGRKRKIIKKYITTHSPRYRSIKKTTGYILKPRYRSIKKTTGYILKPINKNK